MYLSKTFSTHSRCFFFGDVGAHRNPKLLLSYIFGLYDYFLQELYCFNETDNPKKSAIPLVINTSGWVKGEISLALLCIKVLLLIYMLLWNVRGKNYDMMSFRL
jgi:polynucleotide 5'-kinase involved in rRNA processing